jgi:hypothetical protein
VLAAQDSVVDRGLDLPSAVRLRSWEWLFEIGSALSVDIRIVDLRAAPVLSPSAETFPVPLHDPEFIAAVGRAQRAQSVETVQIGRALVAGVVLRPGGSDTAVLVVSRLAAAKPPKAEHWRLEQIASFLRAAVEAHLESQTARSNDDAQRLGALRRALDAQGLTSEQDVMQVFGDAVSIWEDVDFRAFARTTGDEYVRRWMPAGAVADEMPAAISVLPHLQRRELVRLRPEDLDQLGVASVTDVVVVEIAPRHSRWMLVFSGVEDPSCVTRLSLYVDVLEQSLGHVAVSAALDVVRALWDRLIAEDDPARGAESTVAYIVRAVECDYAALQITGPDGRRIVGVGDGSRFHNLDGGISPAELVATRRLETGGGIALAVGRAQGKPPFAEQERHLVDAIADMLAPWAVAVVRRPASTRERRSIARPFQQIAEEIAQRTVRNGGSVSVVVIRLRDGDIAPGAAHRIAAQIRPHLRAAEPAGALDDGEIAALLFDANPDQARAVIARFRRIGGTFEEGEALASAAMGVAHMAAGSAYDAPLIAAARKDALRAGANVRNSTGRQA